jgi:hypothetical protein
MASLRSDFFLYPRLFVGGLIASLRSDFCLYLLLFVGGLMASLRSDFSYKQPGVKKEIRT